MSTPTAISFAQIPSSLQVPGAYMEFNGANANNGASALPYRVLILGQMLSTGTATPLVPVQISNGKAQANALFGTGSMLSNMIAAAVKANNYTEMWAVGVLDNSAGQAASGAITVSGTATAAGMLTAYIGYTGLIDPPQIGVSIGDSAATVATALAEAINEATDLPVIAAIDAANTGKVVITARHKGVDAGALDLRLQYYSSDMIPAGLVVTVTAMSGGAGNPSATAIIAALGDKQYHVVACPWTDTPTYNAWHAEMTRRWSALVAKEGAVVMASHGTPGTINALLETMNSPHVDLWAWQGAPSPAFIEAAAIAGLYAYYYADRPNQPLKGVPVPGIKAPAQADQFTLSERNIQYIDGGSSLIAEADGTVVIEKAVTTYKTNASGVADTSYHGRWVLMTLMYLRASWVNWMSNKFPQVTFADNGTPVISGEVTPDILARETMAWYQAMIDLGLVQDFKGFKTALVSIRNTQNHARNDQLLAPRLVGPLDIIAGQMAFEE